MNFKLAAFVATCVVHSSTSKRHKVSKWYPYSLNFAFVLYLYANHYQLCLALKGYEVERNHGKQPNASRLEILAARVFFRAYDAQHKKVLGHIEMMPDRTMAQTIAEWKTADTKALAKST
ncbi:uncharacterized protein PHALS_00755 [Plasmopara halstedii]|uniref:Uncharacterized protein n=1 Tax=Plasmopara halstedii TaxID=4781 RepID=A0A0N7L6I7_PLAHL|nr:uncharacterized protein PHALS_00755 [Plasmopara halstedii]CEG44387.1 hypothetical protein PHALS_00755 [Plasmopara halstedii]|eukprot:XP_024580756.1 hypothetical protein PHALS_00755 [Plasmopara halstedii]